MDENNPEAPANPDNETIHAPENLIHLLSQKVIGQLSAMRFIVPYVYMYQAGLAPEERPAGIFLLLGPTGTGKTKTVEAIAEVLHGSAKNVLKIDCGEYQLDHEVAKLIGSPPGYVGHRETPPMMTQQKLSEAISEKCDLALVLFDEIEKAAPSLTRLLLGIMDKGVLRLGDNTSVDFEKSLIFFTSNLGAHEMMKEMRPEIGFQAGLPTARPDLANRLESIALAAVRKRFSPEFVNRIDAVVTYQPLDEGSFRVILEQHINDLQRHVDTRLGARCFTLDVSDDARGFLLMRGTSDEYGARELKRTIHRHLTQPLATLVATGRVDPGARVYVDWTEGEETLAIRTERGEPSAQPRAQTLLIVDDNRDLLMFLEHLLSEAGCSLLIAASAKEARAVFVEHRPEVVLLDYLLGREDGVELGLEFQRISPRTQVIIMTGAQLGPEEETVCQERDFPVLRKPFLPNDVLSLVRGRLARESAAAASDASAS